METVRIIFKFIILPITLTIFFNFLEFGFSWDRIDKFIYPIALAVIAVANFFIPYIRRYFLMAALSLLGVMVILYLTGQLSLSESVGSFGFAILLIVVISYTPEIFKKGYIEKF